MHYHMADRKRSGKFYYKNEAKVLRELGFTPAPGSGNGWVVKEDGYNEHAMVQLKSTDAASYRISLFDIKQLEYHAKVEHKLPIFLVQFLKEDKVYALVDVAELDQLPAVFGVEPTQVNNDFVKMAEPEQSNKPKIQSSAKGRDAFYKQQEQTKQGGHKKWQRKT